MMKRRVISLLSMIALLCTMVIFSMPATAVENDTNLSIEAYKALLEDAESGAVALKNAIESGDKEAMRVAAKAIKSSIEWVNFDWETEPFPRYAHHEVYELAGYKRNEWSISSKEDWDAMREVADAANVPKGTEKIEEVAATKSDYFDGVTFHLTNNINFNKKEMKPMGFSIYKEGGGFAGTLDGHGYGFTDVYVRVLKSDTYQTDENGAYLKDKDGDYIAHKNSCTYTGLFYRLADCTIKDFGLNDGLFATDTGNTKSCTSSFGTVISGKTPKFERVWSSAYIYAYSNTRGTALVGTFDNADITVDLNGFVFDGAIVKSSGDNHSGQLTFGVYGTLGTTMGDINSFYNIITDFKSCSGSVDATYTITEKERGVKSALFSFSSVKEYEACDIENVYAVKGKGINEGYFIAGTGFGGSGSEDLLKDKTAAELAWTINNNPSKNADPVYFTLKGGKVRPIPEGKSEGQIVKVTLTGARKETFFFNDGSALDLEKDLKKTDAQIFTVGGKVIDGLTLDGDVEIAVTITCDHKFTYKKGTNEHTKVCTKDCGYQEVEACYAESCTPGGTADAWTHSGTCDGCKGSFTHNCTFEYKETKDGCKLVCSCGNQEETLALLVPGDANNDKTVDLIDAMYALEKAVALSDDANVRNTDVNGNNAVEVDDVYKIILYVLGDTPTQTEFEAAANKVNEGNYYNEGKIEIGNLTMDGEEGFNDRYIRTEYIPVSKGDKIVFGPVRKAQPVMGYFYKAKDNPLDAGLINHTNIDDEPEHTFAEGMIMASVTVPEGAAYVRLQVNTKEEEQFYIRINNDFSVADYQYQTGVDADALENPEKDQYFLTVGDSLGSAEKDSNHIGVLQGWARRIYQHFGSNVINSSQGGSALSTIRYLKENSDANLDTSGSDVNPKQCIVNQINGHRDTGRQFEYILLEGGGNDGSQDAEVGYYIDDDPAKGIQFNPTSYDPKDFAPESTYVGGLERAIYSAIKTHGDTAAIGYMSIYDGPYYGSGKFNNLSKYFQYAKEICDKWKIPYLDLNTSSEFNAEFNPKITSEEKVKAYINNDDGYIYQYTLEQAYDANAHTVDGIHANAKGYDVMQKYIDSFIENEMRPVSQEIYLEVQKYPEIEKVIGMKK